MVSLATDEGAALRQAGGELAQRLGQGLAQHAAREADRIAGVVDVQPDLVSAPDLGVDLELVHELGPARGARRSSVYEHHRDAPRPVRMQQEQAVLRAWDAYAELSALLKDDAWAILKQLRYVRPTNTAARLKAVEREAEKKAIETARYIIPIAAFTSLVHTVSAFSAREIER
ncbi:MAG: hypothetical protein HC794_09650 [Nitrospiraceae bacterium]|nr:hypothetical protein [Nitrospiraceae bacterium]